MLLLPTEVLQAPLLFNFQLSTVNLPGGVFLFSLFPFLVSTFHFRVSMSLALQRNAIRIGALPAIFEGIMQVCKKSE